MDILKSIKTVTVNEEKKQSDSNLRIFGTKIANIHTDITFAEFTDNHLLLVSQNGKIGNVLKVSKHQRGGENFNTAQDVFEVRSLFGVERVEEQAVARFIAEKLGLQKPLIVLLHLYNYDRATVLALLDAVKNKLENDMQFAL